MSLPRDQVQRTRTECGIEALEAKVAALVAKTDAAEARLARAEAALAGFAIAELDRRVSAVEASLGVYEAEGELR